MCYPGRSWFELNLRQKKRMEWNGMEWNGMFVRSLAVCCARDPVLDVMAFL